MKKWHKILRDYLELKKAAPVSRSGVDIAAAALPLLRVALNSDEPVVAAFPDAAAADTACADLAEFCRVTEVEVDLLPLPESGRGKLLFPGGESRRARALDRALKGDFKLLIGSVHALFGPAPPPRETRDALLTLAPGLELAPSELAEKLVALDYDDEFEATVTGEFSRRGGIVDIFSPAHDFPCRVEYFGDTIESLRSFDPQTQRSTGKIASYRVIGRAGITAGGAANSDVFDYFGELDYRLVVVHPASGVEKLRRYAAAAAVKRFADILTERKKRGRFTGFYDPAEAAVAEFAALPAEVLVSPRSETGFDEENQDAAMRTAAAALRCEMLRSRLDETMTSGGQAVMLAAHAEDVEAVRAWAAERHFAFARLEFDHAGFGAGFQLISNRLEVVTEPELIDAGFRLSEFDRGGEKFAEHRSGNAAALPPGKSAAAVIAGAAPPEFSLSDLDVGDYAVHLEHGIGIFRGFKVLSSGGVDREVMVLEYRDGELLYVPLLQADKVSRYLGAAGKLKLHKLGGVRWARDKEEARRGVHVYAADMLRLQAMRQAMPGIAFPEDPGETAAFLRAFPYRDTPDQTRATLEISADMGSLRPMDRLLCGDVGYGKTEIAMRAAFRAVANGYQVAVIAPTTVLVQQHFGSFSERFAAWPCTVGMLSRFCSTAEERSVLSNLASGGLDIVVGTQALCGRGVKFKNLGLVVIDEEQRFGVEAKERLRRFRAEADVLAMSATPIPRTLYLAMAGARDLSTLMTPPKFRLPVKTVISSEDDKLVASAIKAELARGGQVYFLHNRVRTIVERADELRRLVPEARFAVAHGQMDEHELEDVMKRFLSGGIDCLVCSTIIESGLDVPNANTIIIERADRFGLAELYQLRGRVGRWKHQAYAYMLLPRGELVGSDARKRLAAIRRCSSLGAGFQLALRDLEIRGSGNLLGAEQSGHLNAIGFDLYCQLLESEIAKMRGGEAANLPEEEVELAIDFVSFALKAPAAVLAASLPPSYIGAERLRVGLYRRIAGLTSLDGIAELGLELVDRFGPLPPQVENLLAVIRLKLLTVAAKYHYLGVIDGRVVLRNPGGVIYRGSDGKAPTLDYRDAPRLRLRQLEKILLDAASRRAASTGKKA